MIVVAAGCLLALGYALLMVQYRRGWVLQEDMQVPGDFVPSTSVSVIIAARNEAKNIGACIYSILANDYPRELMEVIVVDDHSDDDTSKIVDEYPDNSVRCIRLAEHMEGRLERSYKKAAIDLGIKNSKSTLIITTDADCIVPPKWLKNVAATYEAEKPVMIVAPVIYNTNRSLVQVFQLIDFMSMQGITAAAHRLKLGNMSNGANLAFSRDAYLKVDGYKGIDHLASGDDYLLMAKMNKAFPGMISYLKSEDAVVSTIPQPDWTSFIQQRIRWASKTGKYNDAKLTMILVLVYFFNLAILALFVCGLFQLSLLPLCGVMLLVKSISEYVFLRPVARFFKREWALKHFFWLQPLHIAYIVIAGCLGFVGVYRWKGRVVR